MPERDKPTGTPRRQLKGHLQTICTNCEESLGGQPKVFQGVILCVRCHKITTHMLERAKMEVNAILITYVESLRVACLRKQMRPPIIPRDVSMPPSELKRAMQNLGGSFANSARQTESRSGVRPLRGENNGADGEVPRGAGPQAVPGRG